MGEMHKGLVEIQTEELSQGTLEASLASINDLTTQPENLDDTRMSEVTAIMKKRDRQAHACRN